VENSGQHSCGGRRRRPSGARREAADHAASRLDGAAGTAGFL